MTTVSRITLTGTPYERGVGHGERLASEIRTNLDVYERQYDYRGVDVDAAREDASRFVSLVERINPAYAEEMRGIAAGSGVDLVDVTLLNVRYEVMYSAYSEEAETLASSARPEDLTDGCTSFGVLPSATDDDHTYLGENWDWKPAVETAVLDVRRDDGPDYLAFTEAGIVGGKAGVNERGIGLVINGLVTSEDGTHPFRKPFHVRCKEILDATRFDQALAPVVTTDRSCSANFLVGHAAGEILDLEAAPEVVNYRYPRDGLLTHANHFEDQTRVESTNERRSPNTLYRASRLRRLLSAARPLSRSALEDGLRDHFGRPMSICRHPDASLEPDARSQTNASVVLDLTDRAMYVAGGPPCESTYTRSTVGEPSG